MEFIKPGTYIDFMKYRTPVVVGLGLLAALSLVSLFYPGPNYGIDFAGGTEVQLQFSGDTTSGEIRTALEDAGYSRPDVISVEGEQNQYIIRVRDVSSLPEERVEEIQESVSLALGADVLREMKVSPGGDKITIRVSSPVLEQQLQEALEAGGAKVRSINSLAGSRDPRYEAQLVGVADELAEQLRLAFGDRAPEGVLRVEWVGPKAGQQLRDAAIQSLLYAIAFIMLYVAFRFDLRFAPGGVIAMLHDALITLGIYVLLQKEVNLTTVAALLTIMGYSINDTIVVFDRIRENMVRPRQEPPRADQHQHLADALPHDRHLAHHASFGVGVFLSRHRRDSRHRVCPRRWHPHWHAFLDFHRRADHRADGPAPLQPRARLGP